MMIAEADEDESGMIEYSEFVPIACEVVQTMRLKERVAEVEELTGGEAVRLSPDRSRA